MRRVPQYICALKGRVITSVQIKIAVPNDELSRLWPYVDSVPQEGTASHPQNAREVNYFSIPAQGSLYGP